MEFDLHTVVIATWLVLITLNKQTKKTQTPNPQKPPRTVFLQALAYAAVLNACVLVENKLNAGEFDKPKYKAMTCAGGRARAVGSGGYLARNNGH